VGSQRSLSSAKGIPNFGPGRVGLFKRVFVVGAKRDEVQFKLADDSPTEIDSIYWIVEFSMSRIRGVYPIKEVLVEFFNNSSVPDEINPVVGELTFTPCDGEGALYSQDAL
jgi:hypothetical protein